MQRTDLPPETKSLSRFGFVATARLLLQATWQAHPEPSLRSRWNFVRLYAMQLRRLPTLARWRVPGANSALAEEFAARPSVAFAAGGDYLNTAWSAQRCMAVVYDHYRLLSGRLAFLRMACSNTELMRWPFALEGVAQRLALVLHKPGWLSREGEFALSLYLGPRRIYSLAFTLGSRSAGDLAYIGCLQGSSDADARQLYRQLTRCLHGIRPKDLLLALFRTFGRGIGLARILAIGEAASVCHSARFCERGKVVADYDAFWIEQKGAPCSGGFYVLSTEPLRREPGEVPARKRAQYRRRYEMLAAMDRQIAGALEQLKRHAAVDFRAGNIGAMNHPC